MSRKGTIGPSIPQWTNAPAILYHGTCKTSAQDITANGVRLLRGSCYLDFGPGFYTTENYDQAAAFSRLHHHKQAAVVKIEVDREKLADLSFLAFGNATASFWNLICHHRLAKGQDHRRAKAPHMYDVVVGPVASSWNYDPRKRAIIDGYDQISFHTEKAMGMLSGCSKSLLPV
ncbi:MAG: DUF3990 domain-containing protein [Rhodospirillaceae bacterium]